MLEVMEQNVCQVCHFPLASNFYFCPNCGKKIKEAPPQTNLTAQIGVYAMSIFLPPFGIIPAFRYLRQKDKKSRIIGIIAVLLTILTTVISVWLAVIVFNRVSDETYKQINQYQQYGS
jgi:hypothetical protein